MPNGKWNKSDEEFLIKNFANTKLNVLSDYLNKTESSIKNKVHKLGLKKSDKYLKINSRRFPKGNIPANKGKKMLPEVYEKVKNTMFKKGNQPHNTKFDGALSIRNYDGINYVYLRTSLAKWRQLHQLVWEKHNGKIPPGHKVIFKDKNRFNFEISNLQLVSNAELMQLNSIHRYPEELRKTIRLTAKLRKQIENQLKSQENEI